MQGRQRQQCLWSSLATPFCWFLSSRWDVLFSNKAKNDREEQPKWVSHACATPLFQTLTLPGPYKPKANREFKILQSRNQVNLILTRLSSRCQQTAFLFEDSKEAIVWSLGLLSEYESYAGKSEVFIFFLASDLGTFPAFRIWYSFWLSALSSHLCRLQWWAICFFHSICVSSSPLLRTQEIDEDTWKIQGDHISEVFTSPHLHWHSLTMGGDTFAAEGDHNMNTFR